VCGFLLARFPSGPVWERLQARAPAQGNDIVLCDGCCSRAYHERCVVPRLVAAELSEEDGWLCPACDAKARARAHLSVSPPLMRPVTPQCLSAHGSCTSGRAGAVARPQARGMIVRARAQADILRLINDFFGFEYEQETRWHDVFAEPPTSPAARPASAAAAPLTHATLADFLAHADLPESDSADSSYMRARPPAGPARRPAWRTDYHTGWGCYQGAGCEQGRAVGRDRTVVGSGGSVAPGRPQRRRRRSRVARRRASVAAHTLELCAPCACPYRTRTARPWRDGAAALCRTATRQPGLSLTLTLPCRTSDADSLDEVASPRAGAARRAGGAAGGASGAGADSDSDACSLAPEDPCECAPCRPRARERKRLPATPLRAEARGQRAQKEGTVTDSGAWPGPVLVCRALLLCGVGAAPCRLLAHHHPRSPALGSARAGPRCPATTRRCRSAAPRRPPPPQSPART